MEGINSESSNIHPLALILLFAACLVILIADRRRAVGALLVTAAFVPLGQQIVIAGLHFYFLRILILVGLCRLLLRGESGAFRMLTVDKVFCGLVFSGLICGILRGPKAELFGGVYNAMGTYFLFRILTRNSQDVLSQIRLLAVIGGAIGACMILESITHRNPFYILGGVPELTIERDGHFRCQGPFRHPILAGTFGATLMPVVLGLVLWEGRLNRLTVFGLIGCAITALMAASSGAMLTLIVVIIGFGLWPMRHQMRLFRRILLVGVVGLALVMKAPVWYLIAKISDSVGGTGWHRSYLIDQFLGHFNEWWLIGTSYTAHWAPSGQVLLVDPDNMDITNNYITQGLQGGLLMLSLFLVLIACSFKSVGRCVRDNVVSVRHARLMWALGVALSSHCTAFISISYFDQINVFWFWLLAATTAFSAAGRESALADSLKPAVAFNDAEEMALPILPRFHQPAACIPARGRA